MPKELKAYRVFIASPGGLEVERRAFRDTINEFNEDFANNRGLHFIPIGWELEPPGCGRPQSIINQRVKECDYFVLLLHNRWGTPPVTLDDSLDGQPTSGTHEEFIVAEQCRSDENYPMVDVAPFFKAVEEAHMADPGPQLRQVLNFRKDLETSRSHFYQVFDETDEFKRHLLRKLCQWSSSPGEDQVVTSKSTQMSFVEPLSQLGNVEGLNSEDDSAIVTKLKEARDLAGCGRLVEAESIYVQLVVGRSHALAMECYAMFLQQVGRLSQSKAIYERMLEIITKDEERARILYIIGDVECRRGKVQNAFDRYSESLALDRDASRLNQVSATLGTLGLLEETQSDLVAAERHLNEALSIARMTGNQQVLVGALLNNAVYNIHQERAEVAREYLEEAHGISEALESRYAMAAILGNLGALELSLGNTAKAETYLQEAYAIEDESENFIGVANAIGNLGLVKLKDNCIAEAETLIAGAHVMFAGVGDIQCMAMSWCNMGKLERAKGNKDEAVRNWREARGLFAVLGNRRAASEIAELIDEVVSNQELST